MEVNISRWSGWTHLIALGLGALLWIEGCASSSPTVQKTVSFGTNPATVSGDVIAVLAPADPKLEVVVQQLRNELSTDFNVQVTALPGDREGAEEQISASLLKLKPKAVVLLNNSTARSYRRWAKAQANPPVAVVLMASFADRLQKSIPNSVGIAYEVPAVTSFVGLRALGRKVDRVGIIYRKSFHDYVNAQAELAKVEKVTVRLEELPNDPQLRDLRAAIVRVQRAGVDAIWLPNDNGMLQPRLVSQVWLPYLERVSIPVIVGVPSLVRENPGFGTFGTIPDPEAMAIQAADLLFEIADADWSTRGQAVNLPLSVKTYVAPSLAKRFGIKEQELSNVDFVVGKTSGGAP